MAIRIALAGNPNAGKTTLFNALTGSNQFVGNWPGVTVEKKEGAMKGQEDVIVTDLPGIYSLSPYSPEEMVARRYLAEERPDVILNIVDASNLERNLYLTTQLIELGIPTVIALNMMDMVRKAGDSIDLAGLSKRLGCPVIPISALRGEGVNEVRDAALLVAGGRMPHARHDFSGAVEHALAHIEEAVLHSYPPAFQRFYAIKIFERDRAALDILAIPPEVLSHIEEDILACEAEMDDDAESIIINERYLSVERLLDGVYRKVRSGLTTSDRIDRVMTNRFAALPIFAAIMFLVYFISVTLVGGAVTDFVTDGLFGDGFNLFGRFVPGIPVVIANGLSAIGCWEWLSSLILDGIVAGVGSVLSFVPQILVLFLFLAFLEACGYMSRIAFVLDRLFRKFGLSGKSFIPLLVGTGCSVPGIMASRTIESDRDRRMTIITTSFIPCGAKLPFIALVAGAIFGGAWWVAPSAYFLGIAAVVLSGLILKRTRPFTGDPAPFVMELPPYHMPRPSHVFSSMWERGWSFIKKAGTVILLSTVVLWFLSRFGFTPDGFRMLSDDEISMSFLATIGTLFAWIFLPLGFGTWQAAVATVTGLIAKENIVSTLTILYGTQAGVGAAYSAASGYALLVFNLLCAPCFAAVGAIRQEMQSRRWTAFALAYQCVLAWLAAFVANHLIRLFGGTGSPVGVTLSFLLIAALVLYFAYPLIKKKLNGASLLHRKVRK